jgi:hypothetical protein
MQGDLSADFVPRPEEYRPLKAAVLTQVPNRTVALTTALLGAGGYGKTTLANALCCDDDVRFEFSDGILRAEIGKERNDVTGLVTSSTRTANAPDLPTSSPPPSTWANSSASPASCW